MPEIIETTVYRLDELSDAAKEKARAWYREGGFDYDWFESVYDDFESIAEILGLRLKTRGVRLCGGGTRQKPCIWFSGFSSQGDGACFEIVLFLPEGRPMRDQGICTAGCGATPDCRRLTGDPAPQLLPAQRRGQPSRPLLSSILHGDLSRAR